MTSEILNFTTEEGLQMFDALSRTNSSRQIKPLDQTDYIDYNHRYLYDIYNLQIGDVCTMIPPEFIYVSSESFSQNIQTLRQENSQKQKTGYHKRTVIIDLVFDGMDEINGYKVSAPLHKDGNTNSNYYYVDGLRTLLAQFKLTPFLPIRNELLNDAYKIYVVALQSIVIATIPGFQNVLSAHLTLQEVNMMPYIEMPNIMFRHTIDWDLFRYYTQNILTETHVYKNLQSLPVNKDHTAFKLSILNEDVLQTIDTSEKTKEESILEKIQDDNNFTCLVNSEESDVHITDFQCSYANLLTTIQMSDSDSPTLQYLGGLDTQFNIIFETTDVGTVANIEQCQIQNDLMVRNNPKIRGSIGFVKIEADFVTFCGSLFCTIEAVESHTVQGIPGLYQVRLLCVSYDIAQSRRETLNGFLPFKGEEATIDDLEKSGSDLDKFKKNAEQCIDQSYEGLMKKIYQDNYAEWKLRTSMEVYPDLRLPTYSEVNNAIDNIRKFRANNNLTQLPYSKYPLQPSNVSFGKGDSTNDYPNHWKDEGGDNIYKDGNVPESTIYQGYVDPDFYVFYPNTYLSIYKEEKELENQEKQSAGESGTSLYNEPVTNTDVTVEVKNKIKAIYNNEEDTDTEITKFIGILRTMIGHHYSALSEGEIKDWMGETFDEMGLITWALKKQGILPDNFQRLTNKYITTMDIFQSVSSEDMQRGDILMDSSKTLTMICTGYDQRDNVSVITVTQANGVIEEPLPVPVSYVYRILPIQPDSTMLGTSQSNPYISDGNQYPDENGKIIPKKATLLSTTTGYESKNPYGDDSQRNQQQSIINTTSNTIGSSETVNQDLGTWSPISEAELNSYINSHAPANSPFRGNAKVFLRAAEESGLDPRYILAHAALESGWGTSNIAKKKNNYFGIGAFDSSPYASAKTF